MPIGDTETQVACEPEGRGWLAVYTRHQHEKLASISLAYKGFEVFLPLYTASRRWTDRVKVLSLPLFPGYLFLRGDLRRQLPILTTPGVVGLVGFGGVPAVVPDVEIASVRRALVKGVHIEPYPFLKCGDWVRVRGGPLEGLEGILVRGKSQSRLVISVELVQKSVAVEVDAWLVERVPRRDQAGFSRPYLPIPPIAPRVWGSQALPAAVWK
jgi:transcription antitermination factor NusG